MIRVFYRTDGIWQSGSWDQASIPAGTIWIDLVSPSAEEMRQVQQYLAIDIPTHAEMQEIEASSRLYQENGNYFMTATVVTSPDIDSVEASASTFILSESYLVTVRYLSPKPFDTFAARIQKPGNNCSSSNFLRFFK